MVQCPICGRSMDISLINDHLDSCEKPKNGKQSNILLGLKRKHASSDGAVVIVDDEEVDNEQDDGKADAKPSPVQSLQKVKVEDGRAVVKKPKIDEKELEIKRLRQQMNVPLSERLRPSTLDEYIGQKELLGPHGLLRGFIERDCIPSMILWGPPGVGKTTIARIIAHSTSQRFIEINATTSGIQELKKIFESTQREYFLTKRRTIVFCDEIHRFNKSQQDYFLPFVEKGDVILIGATTENPSFKLNNALLSRCKVFTLTAMSTDDLYKIIHRGVLLLNKCRKFVFDKPLLNLSKDSIDYIADVSSGDSRIAITLLELLDSHFHAPQGIITKDMLKPLLTKSHMIYDKTGDFHYDTISAFHKSIRGSDPDAAMWYLGLMLEGGEDPLYIARRMIRIASEDIGVLDDSCLPFAIAAYEAVTKVGLPEADLALVHCAVKLARAPKSVEIYRGWNQCKRLVHERGSSLQIPLHLRNAPTKLMKELDYGKEYKYNPNFVDGNVKQEYLPESIRGVKFLTGKHMGDLVDPDL